MEICNIDMSSTPDLPRRPRYGMPCDSSDSPWDWDPYTKLLAPHCRPEQANTPQFPIPVAQPRNRHALGLTKANC